MDERRINTIGIHLGESDFCVSVNAGCQIYLHGTTDQIREFAREIIDAAYAHDLASARQNQIESAVAAAIMEAAGV